MQLNRRFCVAPMMDRTDRHERFFLRTLSKKAPLYTEMINVNALLYGKKEKLLLFNKCEHPPAIQLGGSDPYKMTDAAIISEDYGYDEININVGCPSSRVQKAEFGAVLMKNPKLVAKCVKNILNSINLPVTVKCRIGVDFMDEDKDLTKFISEVKDAGCKVFLVHARKAWLKGLSPKENRNLPALNYERVYRLKEEFPNEEIILNGGLETIEDGLEHIKYVDGVMMGRKVYENPYQLIQVDNLFYGLPKMIKSRKEVFLELIPYIIQQKNSGEKIQLITRHFMGLIKGSQFAKKIRTHLANLNFSDKPEEALYQIANQLN